MGGGDEVGMEDLAAQIKGGDVAFDVATAVKNAKAGQVRYRNDKNGIVHTTIGKVDFTADQLTENLVTLLADLKKIKPTSAKGVYMKKVVISTTMGPGLIIDQGSLDV